MKPVAEAPESVLDDFLDIPSDANFWRQVGFLVIDELHLVKQWAEFRPEFPMMGILRTKLRPGDRVRAFGDS